MPQLRGTVRNVVLTIMFGVLLNWASAAVAGPAGVIAGEPKRAYGSIDVIMYQTSW